MKNNIFKTILIVAMIGGFQSCDNYLTETNPNEISADIYWSNLEESNLSLTGVYNAMLSQFILNMPDEALRSDMGYPDIRTNNSAQNDAFYSQTFSETTLQNQQRWETIYQLIFRANQLIEGLNNMGNEFKSQEAWTLQMGQARFFRGLGHFYAHSIYNQGRIIIRDRVPVSSSDFQKELSSSEDVMKFFREDLEYAYQNLPPQMEPKSRVDAGAAATILGTSYLYSEEYPKAMFYFDEVINNPAYGYALVQDPSIMFTAAADYSSESIFEINYANLQPEDANWNEESFFVRLARYTAPNTAGGANNGQIVPPAWITHAYSVEPLDTQDTRNYVPDGNGGIQLRKVSMRASAMIALVNDEHTPYYLQPSAPILESFSNGLRFSWYKKYTNHDIVANENDILDTSWKSAKNIILNRLGDVYLMMAECKAKSGDIDAALDYVNAVRNRWGLVHLGMPDGSAHDFDGETYTEQTFMDHLMYVERPLELSIEGFSTRNIDIRRWGIGETRFKALRAMNFYVTDYQYTDANGGTASRNNSLIKEGISADPTGDPQIDMEYEAAAQFYTAAANDYLPLPANETLNNQNAN